MFVCRNKIQCFNNRDGTFDSVTFRQTHAKTIEFLANNTKLASADITNMSVNFFFQLGIDYLVYGTDHFKL